MRIHNLMAAALVFFASAAGAAEVTVKIDNFTFQPAEIKVHVGDVIEWENEDDIPHTVTQSDFAFHSEALDTGDRFKFTFTTKGEFVYFCSLHPHMVGKVTVLD